MFNGSISGNQNVSKLFTNKSNPLLLNLKIVRPKLNAILKYCYFSIFYSLIIEIYVFQIYFHRICALERVQATNMYQSCLLIDPIHLHYT